jgi:hypothetical protein
MPTVGQITDKISELKSKIAIQEGVVLHLKANFMSSDAGEPEMHFTRDDYATVPEKHITTFIVEAVDEIDALKAQLEEWENLAVPLPGDEPEQPSAPVKRTRKARKKNGTARRHQDHSAPEEDGHEGSG